MKCDVCGGPVKKGKCTVCEKTFDITEKKPENKKMVFCKTCGAEIAKSAKRCPQCGAKNKKPIYKKVWFWIVVVILLLSTCGFTPKNDQPVSTPETHIEALPVQTLSFTIVSGEEGDYGKTRTINAGTEFEETFVEYHVPVGTYTVTNTLADGSCQLSVLDNEYIKNDAGWEESKEGYGTLVLFAGESGSISVGEGQHIHLSDGDVSLAFEQTDATAPEATVEKNLPSEDPVENESSTVEQAPKATTGQKNALRAAKNYLSVMPFSYDGLIKQLEFEQYSSEDAVYAADNCGADWDKQALKSAKNYLSMMPFSYDGLIKQLEFEGYTTEQAVYGADNCGADWNEQAAKSAKNYLDLMAFSRDGLIQQLQFEGYTYEQASYGADANGY